MAGMCVYAISDTFWDEEDFCLEAAEIDMQWCGHFNTNIWRSETFCLNIIKKVTAARAIHTCCCNYYYRYCYYQC